MTTKSINNENSKVKYRAVVLNPRNGNARVESIWFDTREEAIETGKGGVEFYGGTEYIIETNE